MEADTFTEEKKKQILHCMNFLGIHKIGCQPFLFGKAFPFGEKKILATTIKLVYKEKSELAFCILDTGFNGQLMIPESQAKRLGLTFVGGSEILDIGNRKKIMSSVSRNENITIILPLRPLGKKEFYEGNYFVNGQCISITPEPPEAPQDIIETFHSELVVLGLEFFNVYGVSLYGKCNDEFSEKCAMVLVNKDEQLPKWGKHNVLFEL